jgi:uncharacterized membrane-anchored protein YjiN (DUF445 family)
MGYDAPKHRQMPAIDPYTLKQEHLKRRRVLRTRLLVGIVGVFFLTFRVEACAWLGYFLGLWIAARAGEL